MEKHIGGLVYFERPRLEKATQLWLRKAFPLTCGVGMVNRNDFESLTAVIKPMSSWNADHFKQSSWR